MVSVEERFPGGHFPKCIVLQAVYWYLRYSLSYRDIEELMKERGVEVDHATVQRWVVKYIPLLEIEFRKKKKAVGTSWRMDETYIKVKGIWHYLYRAVDKEGNTIDFLLTRKRDKIAAKRFLIKAINNNGFPEKITIDGSAANKAAIEEFNSDNDTTIEVRQVKYLNNIVEQDHRGVKRITNSMLGFKSFDSASITLNGIEIVHMLRKRQLQSQDNSVKNLAEVFYSLAA
ncbi:MAG: IS6 family transposase [Desulfobulbaceae bacterium]|nr:IS6 family transposase [Desulfobulbaceae bacterium]